MNEKSGAGWTSPQVIVACIGLAIGAFGSYNLMQRDDSREVRAELKDHSRRITVLETRQEDLIAERRERRERREAGE